MPVRGSSVAAKGRGRGRGKGKEFVGLCPPNVIASRVATRRQLQKAAQITEDEWVEEMEGDVPDIEAVQEHVPDIVAEQEDVPAEVDVEEEVAHNVESSTSSRVRGLNQGIDEPANERNRVAVKLHTDGR